MLTEITSNLSIFNNEAVTSCTAHADQVFNGLRRVAWNKKLFTFSEKREYINIREQSKKNDRFWASIIDWIAFYI